MILEILQVVIYFRSLLVAAYTLNLLILTKQYCRRVIRCCFLYVTCRTYYSVGVRCKNNALSFLQLELSIHKSRC